MVIGKQLLNYTLFNSNEAFSPYEFNYIEEGTKKF